MFPVRFALQSSRPILGCHTRLFPLGIATFRASACARQVQALEGQKDVYVHEHHSPELGPCQAISLLDKPHPPPSSAVMGYLPPGETTLRPEVFRENKQFRQVLDQVLATSWEKDATLLAKAQYQKEGWLHIEDERNPPPWGRISDPDDILGSVEVRGGKIQPETFQPMPSHRLVSSHGLFKLSEPLHQALMARLNALSSQENKE